MKKLFVAVMAGFFMLIGLAFIANAVDSNIYNNSGSSNEAPGNNGFART